MPIYEYECGRCGAFATSAPMAACARPAPCPGCARPAPRILSPVSVAGPRRGRRRRGHPEPKLVRTDGTRPPPSPAARAARPAHKHAPRPWMLGH
ncbi:MAG: zinc ribbon domain-containing protein [Verrucomicrobiota bacterium]